MSERTDFDKLVDPTVGDIIKFLQQFDPSTPFRIEDPDTNWTISKIEAYTDGGAVWFTGGYYDMGGKDAPEP